MYSDEREQIGTTLNLSLAWPRFFFLCLVWFLNKPFSFYENFSAFRPWFRSSSVFFSLLLPSLWDRRKLNAHTEIIIAFPPSHRRHRISPHSPSRPTAFTLFPPKDTTELCGNTGTSVVHSSPCNGSSNSSSRLPTWCPGATPVRGDVTTTEGHSPLLYNTAPSTKATNPKFKCRADRSLTFYFQLTSFDVKISAALFNTTRGH